MGIKTLLSLAACILLIVVWLSRATGFVKSVKMFWLTKKFSYLKGCIKIIQLFGFDAIVTTCSYFLLGSSNSMFSIQLMIWINAITTFGGQAILDFIKKWSEEHSYV